MGALLRLAAMLVSAVAATFSMVLSLLSRDWHTDVQPERLPSGTRDTNLENEIAATRGETTKALMLRDREAIVSNHEGVLIGLTPLVPTKVGTQGGLEGLSCLRAAAPTPNKDRCDSWIPAFAGMNGAKTAPKLAP